MDLVYIIIIMHGLLHEIACGKHVINIPTIGILVKVIIYNIPVIYYYASYRSKNLMLL